ncbi:MAG: DUF3237 domain-containing protein [Proteobacteria bacterium]|nr:MAG: DUF3237 domain-containing protein [Pseudomonadota bacterium]
MPNDHAQLRGTFVFEVRAHVEEPLVVGDSVHGLRRIVPIVGGTVAGPKLNGKVLAGGADWQFVRPDGTLSAEAKYTLESDDGVLIMVTNRGLRRGPPDVIERLTRGEPVDPAEYYFRTVPEFEAPRDSRYAFLHHSIFVGIAERRPAMAIIRFYEVL